MTDEAERLKLDILARSLTLSLTNEFTPAMIQYFIAEFTRLIDIDNRERPGSLHVSNGLLIVSSTAAI